MKNMKLRKLPKDSVYKDVVVIGNGPSGISLSFMLSGHWPYWAKELTAKHPDELLRARLEYLDNNESLVSHDLYQLAEGLEGRSTNPVSLLLDNLQHPCADLGYELPSMLKYKYHPDKEISHIVLGKDEPGGAWHRMDPNIRTLSLSAWMSLPGFDFKTWQEEQQVKLNKLCTVCKKNQLNNNQDNILMSKTKFLLCKCDNKNQKQYSNNNNSNNEIKLAMDKTLSNKSSNEETRALTSDIAEYYKNYVTKMNLRKYFQNNVIVTSVLPLNKQDAIECNYNRSARWIVTGYHQLTKKPFNYICKNVVLANGSSDFANRLGVRGETHANSWVKHELPELESTLEYLNAKEKLDLKPIIIVGAGLSAADAIQKCRSLKLHVIHVYRNHNTGLDKMLPENIYPEYHEIHKMMQNHTKHHDFYTAYPGYTISQLDHQYSSTGTSHLVTLKNLKTKDAVELDVSYCAILIGSRPDFTFLSVHQPQSTATTETFDLQQKCNKKLEWLKSLCAKCRHLNICERSRRLTEIRRNCGHNNNNRVNNKNLIQNDEELVKLISDSEECKQCMISMLGIGLGENPYKPIDCKSNPILIDKYTHEVQRTQIKGLYAMGPLVSDNFVRFIPGGALAITSALHKEND